MDAVRHDLGDPIMHLIQRGVWQVKSVVKAELNRRIAQHCSQCGRINGRYNFSHLCKKCKAPVENVSRNVDIGDRDFIREELCGESDSTVVIVSRNLTSAQRRILELLIQSMVDGSDHPQSSISRILGISKQRVSQQIEKMKPYLTIG